MIEDLYSYLSSDATLQGLIGSGSGCRLYPNFAPKDPAGDYIVYRIQSDSGRVEGNNINRALLGFSIFAASALAAETIKRRLDVLLDKDSDISVPSSTYQFRSCWLSGGSSTYEQDTKLHHRVALYTLLYR